MIVPQDEILLSEYLENTESQSEDFSSSEEEVNISQNYRAAMI